MLWRTASRPWTVKLASLRTRVTVAICVERKSSKGKKRGYIILLCTRITRHRRNPRKKGFHYRDRAKRTSIMKTEVPTYLGFPSWTHANPVKNCPLNISVKYNSTKVTRPPLPLPPQPPPPRCCNKRSRKGSQEEDGHQKSSSWTPCPFSFIPHGKQIPDF